MSPESRDPEQSEDASVRKPEAQGGAKVAPYATETLPDATAELLADDESDQPTDSRDADSLIVALAEELNGTKVPPVDSTAILLHIGDALKRRGVIDPDGHFVGEPATD
jgi:hypothetical protein